MEYIIFYKHKLTRTKGRDPKPNKYRGVQFNWNMSVFYKRKKNSVKFLNGKKRLESLDRNGCKLFPVFDLKSNLNQHNFERNSTWRPID